MAIITPTVGMVYNFTFLDGWDAFKGIYRVEAIYRYEEYLAEGGDILNDFYIPNGKEQDDVVNDLPKLRVAKFYKLATVDESIPTTIYYAPDIYFEASPDYNVKQYYKFGLVCLVGITKEQEDLTYIKSNIVENVEASLGITPEPNFVNLGKVWMTDQQYNEELAKRDENKKRIINYFSEMRKLSLELAAAQQKIAEYEKYIIQLNSGATEEPPPSSPETIRVIKKKVGKA